MIGEQDRETPGVGYDQLDDLLLTLDVFVSPSELHGWLCGQLVQGAVRTEQDWLKNAAIYLERERIESEEIANALGSLYRQSFHELAGSGFSLCLVLPDDDSELALRAGCMGLWCQGFVAGFGHAKLSGLSEDARESFTHMEQISRINSGEELDDSEENEEDLMQLVEYVRMAVILLYSEVFGVEGNQPSQSLH